MLWMVAVLWWLMLGEAVVVVVEVQPFRISPSRDHLGVTPPGEEGRLNGEPVGRMYSLGNSN